MLRDPVDQLGLIEYDPAGAVDYLDGIDGRTDAFGGDADRRFEILRRLIVLAGRARSNDVGWCSSHSSSLFPPANNHLRVEKKLTEAVHLVTARANPSQRSGSESTDDMPKAEGVPEILSEPIALAAERRNGDRAYAPLEPKG